jgi:hypothetical protein
VPCKTNGSATSCACASGCHASRLSRTGSATAADTAGPGTVTGWRGPAKATAGTHPAFLRDRAPARPLFQEAVEEGGHNWVRNALAASLNRMPGVQAVFEPMVTTRRAPGDQRRGDIKVMKSGTIWILDVGIICPGSQRLVSTGSSARALTQSQARRQLSTTARRRRRKAYQRGRPAIPLQDPAVGGRGQGWTYAEAWTCCTARHLAAPHGHWRFSRATCLHSLPRRYTRLIVLLKMRGRGATCSNSDYQDLGRARS